MEDLGGFRRLGFGSEMTEEEEQGLKVSLNSLSGIWRFGTCLRKHEGFIEGFLQITPSVVSLL